MEERDFYEGRFLIAMPGMGDPRFEQTVIYMCAHTEQGAMGLVINKPAPDITLTGMLEQLGIIGEEEDTIRLPASLRGKPVHLGGPVEPARGFVLHSSDYHIPEGTLRVDDAVSLSATLDILRAMVSGAGPRHSLLALGYAGWGPGQLEGEMAMNGWLVADADEEILFRLPSEQRYEAALARLGITPGMLSSEAGHS